MASAKTEKFELLKAMNTIVRSLNHEGAYYDRWILIVPDEATDEDLRDIAEDDDDEIFRDSVKCFEGIMRDYIKDGLYVAGKLY